MLVEAIWGIIAISTVFCCCTFCCYLLFHCLFYSEGKNDVEPETEVWESRHFYDPLPLSTPSPPDTICKPTPYSFKLQNGNGVYAAALPHAVINPAVLQYPPGHVLDQQRVPPPVQQKQKQAKEKSRTRSRSPSPSSRKPKNVWSTNVEHNHHRPYNYNNHHHRNSYHQDSHQRFHQQIKNLSQEFEYEQEHDIPQFIASTHATNNVFTYHQNHHQQQRYKSRLKEAVT